MIGATRDLNKFISVFELYLDSDEIEIVIKILQSASFRGYTDMERKVYSDLVNIFVDELSTYEY